VKHLPSYRLGGPVKWSDHGFTVEESRSSTVWHCLCPHKFVETSAHPTDQMRYK